ncbi:WD40 repeat domain-containing protein [Corallococcus sp. CA031C]|nr:WD40 repeat domain-containing protein [Corallococcus sp. CA031C]
MKSHPRIAAVVTLVGLVACSGETPPPATPPPPPIVLPVSSAAPFRACGAIGAGALAASSLSPDGTVLAAATLSGQLVLFRRADGSRLHTFWELPGQQVGVAFSPDGHRLVASSRTETRVWSFPDLTPVRTFARPHSDRTTAVAISPDGAFVATGGFDAATEDTALVRIWSVADGNLRGSWQRRFEQEVRSLAFSPDGTSLAIAVHHSVVTVQVPDASGSRFFPPLSGGQLAWSKEGGLVASGGVVVRLDTGAVVKELEGSMIHDASAFSPDGMLYAEGLGPDVTVYRVADWTKVHSFSEAKTSYVSGLAFSRDSAELIVDLGVNAFWCNGSGQLCGPWGNEIRIHPVENPDTVRTVSLGPEMQGFVTFSPEGSLLATHADGALALWRTSDLGAVAAPAIPQPWRVQFSPDLGRLLVNGGLYDRASGQLLQDSVQAVSPDFKTAARHEADQIIVSDFASGERRKTFAVSAGVSGFSPDGRFVAAFSYLSGRGDLRLLDVTGDSPDRTFAMAFSRGGPRVDFSRDGRWLASAAYDGSSTVEVLGLQAAAGEGASLESSFAAVFSPDSTVLATGGMGPEVRLWRTSDFTLRERLLGHGTSIAQEQWPESIIGAAFSSTGQLATLGADRTVRLWCSP